MKKSRSKPHRRPKAKSSGIRFRPTITLPDGTVIKASDYGLRAFPIGKR